MVYTKWQDLQMRLSLPFAITCSLKIVFVLCFVLETFSYSQTQYVLQILCHNVCVWGGGGGGGCVCVCIYIYIYMGIRTISPWTISPDNIPPGNIPPEPPPPPPVQNPPRSNIPLDNIPPDNIPPG